MNSANRNQAEIELLRQRRGVEVGTSMMCENGCGNQKMCDRMDARKASNPRQNVEYYGKISLRKIPMCERLLSYCLLRTIEQSITPYTMYNEDEKSSDNGIAVARVMWTGLRMEKESSC